MDEERGITLYRIVALEDFEAIHKHVKKGELGGYVTGLHNLSQHNSCWIGDNAKAYGQSRILESAVLLDNAMIFDDVELNGLSCVKNNVTIRENVTLTGESIVRDSAIIEGNVYLSGKVEISDNAYLTGDVTASGLCRFSQDCYVYGHSNFEDRVYIRGHCIIGGFASLRGDITVTDNALIKEHAKIESKEQRISIGGNAKILGYSVVWYDVKNSNIINVGLSENIENLSKLHMFDPNEKKKKNDKVDGIIKKLASK